MLHRDNRLPRVMKQYSPTGRRSRGRLLKRLLDAWDRNGSTSGPTPWKIDDDDVAPWQYASSCITRHQQLSGKTSDICCAPSTLFSWPSPSKLFPVSQIKTTLKGRRFQTIEEIQENAIRELRAIEESACQEAFQQRKKRWERCIASRGDCFEGYSVWNVVKWAINSLQRNFNRFLTHLVHKPLVLFHNNTIFSLRNFCSDVRL